MNKKLLTIIAVFICVGAGSFIGWYIFFRPAADVRMARWGMSKEDVRARESATLESERPDVLFYGTRFLGQFPAALGYYFEENSLTSVKFVAFNRYEEFKGCLQEYQVIFNYCVDMYGAPKTHTNQDFREATWNTERSRIVLRTLFTQDEKYIWMLEYKKLRS